MDDLKPDFTIRSLEEHGEVHFAAMGFWNLETLQAFERAMQKTLAPIVQSGKKLRFLADLRQLVTQDRVVADGIKQLIDHSIKLGNERTAIIADSKLTVLQHRRLNTSTNLEVFEDKTEALTWLRG